MMPLAARDRTQLSKLLALLGSDHAGERDAAGLAAHRLVRKCGATWEDVLNPPPGDRKLPEFGTWRQTVAQCLERPGSLSSWELGFLRHLPGFRRLSDKQRRCLKTIADRVLERAP